MKRIKCLSALLTLIFLFCVGNVDAQVKTISAGQQVEKIQKVERKAAPNAKKATTSTAPKKKTNKVSALQFTKVASQQTIKVDPVTSKVKKAGSTTTTNNQVTKTNNVNNLKLAPVYGAKANPVSPVQLQGNGTSGKGNSVSGKGVANTGKSVRSASYNVQSPSIDMSKVAELKSQGLSRKQVQEKIKN